MIIDLGFEGYTTEEINDLLAQKQDELVSGTNIKTINNISLLGSGNIDIQGGGGGGTYTAGNGLNLSNNEFSIDDTVVATKTDLNAIPNDVTRSQTDATFVHKVGNDITNLFYLREATSSMAGLMTASDKTKLSDLPTNANLQTALNNKQGKLTAGAGINLTTNNEIDIDNMVVAFKSDLNGKQNTLTAGSNITIQNDTISATVPDISGLATKTELNTGLAGKQDTLTAGTNITIDSNNVISATGTSYTAGTGLNLTGTQFSVDTTTIATKTDLNAKQDALTAGTNVQISGNTISATDTTYTFASPMSVSANNEVSINLGSYYTSSQVDTIIGNMQFIAGGTDVTAAVNNVSTSLANNYYTKSDIDDTIGDINTILASI